MRLPWLSTTRKQPASSPHSAAANGSAHTRLRSGLKRGLKRLLWFVALWCAGVAGAMLLALPFRLLMQAAMH
jgi:hypothetical protein